MGSQSTKLPKTFTGEPKPSPASLVSSWRHSDVLRHELHRLIEWTDRSFFKGRHLPGTVMSSRRGPDQVLAPFHNTRALASPVELLLPASSGISFGKPPCFYSADSNKFPSSVAGVGEIVCGSQGPFKTTMDEREEPAHRSPSGIPECGPAAPHNSLNLHSARDKKFTRVLAEPTVNLKVLFLVFVFSLF